MRELGSGVQQFGLLRVELETKVLLYYHDPTLQYTARLGWPGKYGLPVISSLKVTEDPCLEGTAEVTLSLLTHHNLYVLTCTC